MNVETSGVLFEAKIPNFKVPDLLFAPKSLSAAPIYHPRAECAVISAF